MQFERSSIIVPCGKTQSCKVSSGLLHPVLSAFTQTVPLIATSGPESCTSVHWQTRGTERKGMQRTSEAWQRLIIIGKGSPRRTKEGRLHDTISILHVCLRPWLHVALLPCNLTSSTLGDGAPRPSSSTYALRHLALLSHFRHRFSMAGIHYWPSPISPQSHYAINFPVLSCSLWKKNQFFYRTVPVTIISLHI